MRYMLILQYDEAAARATPPDPAVFEEMAAFNTAMVDAGVLLTGEGLAPSDQGAVVAFEADGATVADGPFTEAKELIGGFWILQVASREEAVGWARRAPFRGGERIQVRRITEAADFEAVAPEGVLENEERLRGRIEQQHGS
jgi:hypothetical protein